jgi:basic amino acid/polyamine antiporter, APA family
MTETPHDLPGEAVGHPPPAAAVVQTAGDGAGAAQERGFGLPVAIALIMGSIIGVGIFNLPTSLAGIGPITLASMALTTVGAIALALMFAALSRRLPADGGPYAYSRAAFGNVVGFSTRGRTGSRRGRATRG